MKKQTKQTKRTKQTKGHSLVFNISLFIFLAISVTTALSIYVKDYWTKALYNSEKRKQFQTFANTAANVVKNYVLIEDYNSLSKVMGELLSTNDGIVDAFITDKNAKIIYDVSNTLFGRKFSKTMVAIDTKYVSADIKIAIGWGAGPSTRIGRVYISYVERNPLEVEKIRNSFFLAQSLSKGLVNAIATTDFLQIGNTVTDLLKSQEDAVYCLIMQENGRLLNFAAKRKKDEKIFSDKIGTILNDTISKKALHILKGNKSIAIQNIREDSTGKKLLDIAIAIRQEGRQLGVIRIGYSLTSMENAQKRSNLILSLIVLTAIIVNLLIAFYEGKRIALPILQLSEAAKKIAGGHLSAKVNIQSGGRETRQLGESFNQMITDLLRKNRLESSFSKYVTQEVAEKILDGKEEVGLSGEKRYVTVLFVDIRGFTAIAEKLHPEKVVSLLNKYFEILVDVVFYYGGTVDKFIGDCMMIVFGAPFYQGNDTERAIKCAFAIQKEIERFNKIQREKNEQKITAGIGINTGFAIAGNVGSTKRLEYTVIGDTVNLAARLQTLAGSGEIIANESVFLELKEILETDSPIFLKVKGKSEPIKAYKLLGYIDKKDKRRYKRIDTQLTMRFQVISGTIAEIPPSSSLNTFTATVTNVSAGGCTFIFPDSKSEFVSPLQTGTVCQMEIDMPNRVTLKTIESRVLDCALKNGIFFVRVLYEEISTQNRDEIVKFVYDEMEKGTSESEHI